MPILTALDLSSSFLSHLGLKLRTGGEEEVLLGCETVLSNRTIDRGSNVTDGANGR